MKEFFKWVGVAILGVGGFIVYFAFYAFMLVLALYVGFRILNWFI